MALISIVGIILLLQSNNYNLSSKFENKNYLKDEYDILKPKFTISNNNSNILITANNGNFIGENNILLKNNVLFKSKEFKIYSSEVLFNKSKQTANSKSDSTFFSKGTKIKSEGFNIIENGNLIKFNGKTILTLSK